MHREVGLLSFPVIYERVVTLEPPSSFNMYNNHCSQVSKVFGGGGWYDYNDFGLGVEIFEQ